MSFVPYVILKIFSNIKKVETTLRMCSQKKTSMSSTAGIIVIGDEILKGEVLDTNSNFLASELHKLGVNLKKISVIGDEVAEVCEEVKIFSRSFNYVLTTGGIGPTHDDITYEAVALAFNEPLVLNSHLRDICSKYYKTDDVKGPGMKLAYVCCLYTEQALWYHMDCSCFENIPKSAKLNYNDNPDKKMPFPNVSIENVYMFPGIPELLVRSFNSIKELLFLSDQKYCSKCMYFNITEDKIVRFLDILVKEFPDVKFGSYPKLFDDSYKVKVTIECCDEDMTKRAYQKLLELVPQEHIVDLNQK